MRNATALVLMLGSVVALGCEDEKKTVAPAPSSSAATAASAPMPSASAAPKLSMPEMQAATMKVLLDGANKHDAKLVASAYAPEAVVKAPGTPDVTGRAAIEADRVKLYTGVPDGKLAIGRVWQKGNTEAVEWAFTGTNTGEWMGQKATGRPIGGNGLSIYVFNDAGLIVEQRRYMDIPTLQSQMDPKAKAGTFRAIPTLPTATETHVAKDDEATLKQANAMYAAFDSHKPADFMAFVTDATVYDDYTLPAQAKGTKAIKDVYASYLTAFPDFKQTYPLQIVADGYVVTEGILTGTNKGAIGPFKASNKPVTLHFVDVFQLKDSKIVSGVTYMNSQELLTQIGAVPAPGAVPSASAAASAAQPAPKASPK